MSFRDMTVECFLEELASKSPAPGGGSASAIAAAMGAGLVSMVVALTETSEMPEDDSARIKQTGLRAEALRAELLRCADEDTAAFNAVMAAYRMPRKTDEEKRTRREAIQTGLKGAANAPMKTLELAMEGLHLAAYMAQKGNKNAVSDAGVGAQLFNAAACGAIFNIEINLSSIKDADFVSRARAKVAAYDLEREKLRKGSLDAVSERIGAN
ncbi:MAG: cyclodeaminase/cyclohydrolase family protein [Firmicutes bacterium]|jgi:formiminotetrahydrofolate cyclodeaminase|nr:cyclodeaminase/cyclohydrolase family protein [Bacillota bacterium]MDD4336100.1 cyclodeaminase/cyclohydrolase family protein [Bacillota bacterium]MDD4792178.1 cyclodeaminase/cyclohydrolase family protein [Bacillota bacterium]